MGKHEHARRIVLSPSEGSRQAIRVKTPSFTRLFANLFRLCVAYI
jgi:hypothetical protein